MTPEALLAGSGYQGKQSVCSVKGFMVEELSAASRRNLQAYAETHNRGVAIVKRLRDAGGKHRPDGHLPLSAREQDRSNPRRARVSSGRLFNNVEQEGFRTMLKLSHATPTSLSRTSEARVILCMRRLQGRTNVCAK